MERRGEVVPGGGSISLFRDVFYAKKPCYASYASSRRDMAMRDSIV
jgi:hypothetical protein